MFLVGHFIVTIWSIDCINDVNLSVNDVNLSANELTLIII